MLLASQEKCYASLESIKQASELIRQASDRLAITRESIIARKHKKSPFKINSICTDSLEFQTKYEFKFSSPTHYFNENDSAHYVRCAKTCMLRPLCRENKIQPLNGCITTCVLRLLCKENDLFTDTLE